MSANSRSQPEELLAVPIPDGRGQEARRTGRMCWPDRKPARVFPPRLPTARGVSPVCHNRRHAAAHGYSRRGRGWQSSRAGLSLTEVLMATFVAVVGLVSLAAMLPVGIFKITAANRLDSASAVGRNAWREVERSNLAQFRRTDITPLDYPASLLYEGNGNPVPLEDPRLLGAYVIDPFGMSVPGMRAFPDHPTNGALRLPRFTIRRLGVRNNGNPMPLAAQAPDDPTAAVMRSLFSSRHDGVYAEQINVDTGRRERMVDQSGSFQSHGRYSWFITVSPSLSNRLDPVTGGYDQDAMATVSVAVCHNRPAPAGGGYLANEEFVFAVAFVAPAVGPQQMLIPAIQGGDVVIGWQAPSAEDSVPRLHSGDWIMLYAARNVAMHPQFQSVRPDVAQTGIIEARWYRIESLGALRSEGTNHWRMARLVGPDWDIPPMALGGQPAGHPEAIGYLHASNYPGSALTHYTAFGAVVSRVAAVFDKTMRLQPEETRLGGGF